MKTLALLTDGVASALPNVLILLLIISPVSVPVVIGKSPPSSPSLPSAPAGPVAPSLPSAPAGPVAPVAPVGH